MLPETFKMRFVEFLLKTSILLALLSSSPVRGQTTVQFCGNTPADVVFLLDSSNSMWGPDFLQQLEFVSNVTQMFQIGKNATQVGLATFNDDVQLQFYLNEFRDREKLLRAIRTVRQTNGMSTATDKALKFLRTRFFSNRYGARSGVPHIAIVITDGQSDHTLRTLIEATKAKRHNINIFTVGVGEDVNSLELERMASSPSHEYAFVVDSFSFLDSIKEKLAIKTCLVTASPTTLPTTKSTTSTTTPSTSPSTEAAATTTLETTISEETIPTSTTTTTTTTTTSTTSPPTTTTTSTTTSTTTETTTTETTTTTIPLPTTTTWVDIVRRICEKKPVDVVFALDSSDAVSPNDFWYQVKFIRDLTWGLDVGVNKTRIGAVLYGDSVVPVFDVNDHSSLSSAIGDLYKVERTHGGTRIDKVIHYVRTKSFRRTVSRREAAQLLVILTSQASENLHGVKKEANKARSTGVNILVIGVGDKVNTEELSIIAGVDAYESGSDMDEFMPYFEQSPERRRRIFHTKSFSDLDSIVMEATITTCTADVTQVPVSDQACGTRQEADMMFVMDSASAGKKNTKKSLDFIKHVAKAMDVGEETVQIGMMKPEDCIPQGESFRLNSHKDRDHVVSALDQPADDDKLSQLIKNLRKDAFKKKKGGRAEAKKIAVVLVDGELQHPMKVLKEARRAQIHGIEVYVIFVGRDAPQAEVRDMCAYPPSKHFIQVPDYDKLKDFEDSLIELLCDEL